MTATLFDLSQYHRELPPDPNAPYSADEMLEFIGEAEAENDSNRLLWLFLYLCRHAETFSELEYRRVFERHEKASKAVSQGDRVLGKAR